MFSEIHHEIKEKDDKKNAAIKIQSFWRGVLTRRKTKIMLKGFRKLNALCLAANIRLDCERTEP